jgi:hypothetical protein
LENREVRDHLESRQDFDANHAIRWVHTEIRNLDTGRLIPADEEMAIRMRTIKGAPLAIWPGRLLDGVPESLAIGASLAYHEISLALVASSQRIATRWTQETGHPGWHATRHNRRGVFRTSQARNRSLSFTFCLFRAIEWPSSPGKTDSSYSTARIIKGWIIPVALRLDHHNCIQ